MTAKHATPEWRRTVKIVRAQVRMAWAAGDVVPCWRTGKQIVPGEPFDVGHIDPNGGEGIDNAAPEKRSANRSEGGRRGAAITNSRRRRAGVISSVVTQMEVPPWAA